MRDYDVLIVGGGPVGAAAALALRGCGLEVGLLDGRASRVADAGGQADSRPIALAHGSRLILERLGVWQRLQMPTPIERIHVSQRGGFGRVELDAGEAGLPALGYVVDYGQLDGALAGALEGGREVVRARAARFVPAAQEVAVHYESAQGPGWATARLVAVADGGALAAAQSSTRDYGQAVVTARVDCSCPRRNVAFERFAPEGPLALLPSGDSYALVWTTRPDCAQELCALTDADFLARLQEAFGGRVGTFQRASARSRYPIALKVAERIADSRIVALGNAAQTLHPVAGQGFNLGLRDAWELAALLRGCSREREQIGAAPLLARYRARRRLDRRGGIGFTDALVRLFSNDIAPVKLARGLGLALLGAAPPARDFVVKRMTFGARG